MNAKNYFWNVYFAGKENQSDTRGINPSGNYNKELTL